MIRFDSLKWLWILDESAMFRTYDSKGCFFTETWPNSIYCLRGRFSGNIYHWTSLSKCFPKICTSLKYVNRIINCISISSHWFSLLAKCWPIFYHCPFISRSNVIYRWPCLGEYFPKIYRSLKSRRNAPYKRESQSSRQNICPDLYFITLKLNKTYVDFSYNSVIQRNSLKMFRKY